MLVHALRGDVAEVRARAAEARELIVRTDFDPVLANTESPVGLLELSLGDPESAHRVLAPLNGRIAVAPVRESGWFRFLADDAEALIALGDFDAAGATLAKLEGRRHTLLDQAWATQAALRCRGLLRIASGDAEAGFEVLHRAVALSERGQEPLEHARNLLALGRSQRRLKQRGAARDSLERAGEIFERLGTPLWRERAGEELSRIGGRPRRSPGLTETEQRVARLAASGLTNREIAAAAFLSVNTVQAYLKRIYRELGVRSRTELARELAHDEQSKSTGSGVSGAPPGP
jgi:DNA-binding CsgD family transcriptional regulator